MKSLILKRSVVLRGHKTSISVEDAFWNSVKEIAASHPARVNSCLLAPNICLNERKHLEHQVGTSAGIVIMPITQLLDSVKFDPEAKRIMGVAFEMTCAALKYTNRPDIAHEALAIRIIELAKNGVLDPDRLCERVLDDLRKLPPRL